MSEDPRLQERIPVVQMVVVGTIASALGIAAGLAIEWFPEQATTQADAIDHLYDVLIWSSVPVFVLVTTIVCFSVWKFKMRPGEESMDGPPIHGNTRLEVIWTAIPAIILVVLCSYAWIVLNDIEEAKAGEMRIDVTGQQFAWSYEYPQPNGKPIKSNQLYLIKGQPVRFNVTALDVIHDFWVPAFRMKIDAVPGIATRYRVTPNRIGRYPVVCAELCGLGHSVMRSTANVVSRTDFDKWLAQRKGSGQAGGGAAPDGKKLFTDGNGTATACGSCHTLKDAGTTATTGPDLDKVLRDPSPDELEESIVKPDAKITPGFEKGIMPKTYGDTLSPKELDALVKYLGEAAGK